MKIILVIVLDMKRFGILLKLNINFFYLGIHFGLFCLNFIHNFYFHFTSPLKGLLIQNHWLIITQLMEKKK